MYLVIESWRNEENGGRVAIGMVRWRSGGATAAAAWRPGDSYRALAKPAKRGGAMAASELCMGVAWRHQKTKAVSKNRQRKLSKTNGEEEGAKKAWLMA
jgi:hypothetical protein